MFSFCTHTSFSVVFLFNYYFKYKFDVNGKWKYEYLNFGSIRSGLFVFIEFFFGWPLFLISCSERYSYPKLIVSGYFFQSLSLIKTWHHKDLYRKTQKFVDISEMFINIFDVSKDIFFCIYKLFYVKKNKSHDRHNRGITEWFLT